MLLDSTWPVLFVHLVAPVHLTAFIFRMLLNYTDWSGLFAPLVALVHVTAQILFFLNKICPLFLRIVLRLSM
jgi:hypothetical protein